MKIKVCGITQLEQLKQLDELGVDYAGLIFYGHSPRYMADKLKSKEVLDTHFTIKKVGVFVNAAEDEIKKQMGLYALDLVQLHGDETPSFCNNISNYVNVIKAFRINKNNEQNIDWMIKPYEEFCDYYLFDTDSKGTYGGTGEKFDWKILNNNKINKPFFLSGGIGLEDAEKVKVFHHSFFHAVDINSKVEVSDGVKDMEVIKKFKNEIEKII